MPRISATRVVGVVLSWLMVASGLALALAIPTAEDAGALQYPHNDQVTYKEYWVDHREFPGGCSTVKAPNERIFYLEPSPCSHTIEFEIPDDFSNAIRAEIYLNLWRNRDVPRIRFTLNGHQERAPDVGSDFSRSPWLGDIPLSELNQGTNTMVFSSGLPVHVQDILIRIYHDANNPLIPGNGSDTTPPSGALTSIVADNGAFDPSVPGQLLVDSNELTFTATANGGDVAFVEFHAWYEGYDLDNNGITREWQATNRNNWNPGGRGERPGGGTINHPGTDTVAPYQVTWDLPHVINQAGVKFKIRVVDTSGNVTEAAGGVSADFELVRNYQTEAYTIPDFEDILLHADGLVADFARRVINLPDDFEGITDAYFIGNYWSNPQVSLNGHRAFNVHEEGLGEDTWVLSRRQLQLDQIGPGRNNIEYLYRGVGYGHFVEKPGPMIILHRDLGPAAAPTILTQPTAQTVSPSMPATFHVEATGVPRPSYQWRRNGVEIPGANDATYVTPRLNASSAGDVFDVVVSNASGSITSSSVGVTVRTPDPWWNTNWPYRLEITVDADGYERIDKPVDVPMNWTEILDGIGESGAFDPATLRVVEVDAAGTVIDNEILVQFDRGSNFDFVENAVGVLTFMMEGTTLPDEVRRFHVYFSKRNSGLPELQQDNLVEVIDNVLDEGQESFRIETPGGDWTYDKEGGGFTSLDDADGFDWINWNPTPGPGGFFRGIPNSVEGNVLHPGGNQARTTLVSFGPLKTILKTTARQGDFEIFWDIFPTYALGTFTRATDDFWFLYEGTPGLGSFDAGRDFVIRPDGTQTSIQTSWTGDMRGDEWAIIGDPQAGRSIFVAQVDDDNAIDSYFQNGQLMTVLGFGRRGTDPFLRRTPKQFTVGLIDTINYSEGKVFVDSATKPLAFHHSLGETQAGAIAPGAPTEVVAERGDASATVTWEPPAQNGGTVLTGYTVTANPGPVTAQITGEADSATVTGLTNDVAYTFTVTATNEIGTGPPSEPSEPVTPTAIAPIVSDDFDTPGVRARWQLFDARADEEHPDYDEDAEPPTVEATADELVFRIPGERSHNLFARELWAPRLLQEVPDSDFQVELKYNNQPSELFQFHGFVAQEDEDTLVRFDFLFAQSPGFGDGVLKINAARIRDGFSEIVIDEIAVGNPDRLRVTRSGLVWTLEYSEDGTTWIEAGNFEFRMTMTEAGPFAGNHQVPYENAPEFISRLDYIFNTASPIVPEDGTPDADPLVVSDVEISASDDQAFVRWRTNRLTTGYVDVGTTTAYDVDTSSTTELDFFHEAVVTGLTPATAHLFRVTVTDERPVTEVVDNLAATTLAAGEADTILDIWYGLNRTFGTNGQPQRWINILGNVTDVDGIESVTYSLNGGEERQLSFRADERRLQNEGDINLDPGFSEMLTGLNTILITVTDVYGEITTKQVELDVTFDEPWPLPYEVKWDQVANIDDVAQPVDGNWTIENGKVKAIDIGYDRLLNMGDLDWTDYQVTVPVTMYGIDEEGYEFPSSGPAIGVIMRWPGHYDWDGSQPFYGFAPLGAAGWYRFFPNRVVQRLTISDGDGNNAVTAGDAFQMQYGVTYIFKFRVQTITEGESGHLYTLTVYEEGQSEQSGVTISTLQPSTGLQSGSLLLVAHHVDGEFGDVLIEPVNPSINPVISPPAGTYTTGQTVTITTPDPLATVYYTIDGSPPNEQSPVYDGPFRVNVDTKITAIAIRDGVDVSGVVSNQYAVRPNSSGVSDDFSSGALNTDLWQVMDVQDDVLVGTNGEDLTLHMPAGGIHDLAPGRLLAPRVLQPVDNPRNFQVTLAMDDTYNGSFTMQGLLVQQNFRDFLRFEVYQRNSAYFAFGVSSFDGVFPQPQDYQLNRRLLSPITPFSSGQLFLRITRNNTLWTIEVSPDNVTWYHQTSFRYALFVTAIGPWAGSFGAGGPAPEMTGTFDWIEFASDPLATEDGVAPANLTPTLNAVDNLEVEVGAGATLDAVVSDDGNPGPLATTWTQISGPAPAVIQTPTDVTTPVSFTKAGVYAFRIEVTDGEYTVYDALTVTVRPNTGAPEVDAGTANRLTTEGVLELDATVTDLAMPGPNPTTVQWSVLQGPGTVTFGDDTAIDTTATFDLPGEYLIELTADDGLNQSSDALPVSVVRPRSRDGLIVLYDFDDGGGKIIEDVSAVGQAPLDLHINNVNRVAWTRNSLETQFDPEIVTIDPIGKITNRVMNSGEFTVEMWVRTSDMTQTGPGRIMTIAKDSDDRNLMIGQGTGQFASGSQIQVRNRTTTTNKNGIPAEDSGLGTFSDLLLHVVVTYDTNGDQKIYIDGELVESVNVGALDWQPDMILGIGNEINSVRPWFGEYHLLAMYDRAFTQAQILDHFDHGPNVIGGNLAPTVTATAAASTVTRPAPLAVSGDVVDDRRPVRGELTFRWQQVSGPGTATFVDPLALSTDVNFDLAGTYVLELAADDGEYVTSGTITVEVLPIPPNSPPVVDAGADQVIEIIGGTALTGSVSDDSLPWPGTLSIGWTQVSGPAPATFADPTDPTSAVNFTDIGIYVFELAADDTEDISTDQVTIEVTEPARADNGLVALYDFAEGGGSVVRDVSGVGSPLDLTIADPDHVNWGDGAISIVEPTVLSTAGPATKIINAIKFTNEYTIEAWVNPRDLLPTTPGRLVTISESSALRNISLGQGFWVGQPADRFQARTTTTFSSGQSQAIMANDGLAHVVYTREDDIKRSKLYLNGVLVQQVFSYGDLSNWNNNYPLVLGNEPNGNRPYLGDFVLVGIYNEALSLEDVERNYLAPPESQLPPTVSAGPDQLIEFPLPATLDGTVIDDGLPDPPGSTTAQWTMISGPGTVTFADDTAVDTTATFSAGGVYVLELAGFDGSLTTTDRTVITVADNVAPTVSAGADFVVEVGVTYPIDATVDDDGLPDPPRSVTATWSATGPGNADFSAPTAVDTNVTFDTPGTYTLTLTAFDGALTTTDSIIATVATNTAPLVDAGPATVTLQVSAALSLDGTVIDDGLPNPPSRVTGQWSVVSGPGAVTFANSNRIDTDVSFSGVGTYVLRLIGTDSVLSASDDITVVVTEVRRVDDGLLALYGFDEPSGSVIRDISGQGVPMDLNMVAPGNISRVDGGVSFDGPAAIMTPGPASKVIDAVRASQEITIEMWVRPDQLNPPDPGRVVTFSNSTNERNMTIGQGYWPGKPTNFWRAQNSGAFGTTGSPVGAVKESVLQHVVFVRDNDDPDGSAQLYVDGVLQGDVGRFPGLSEWNPDYPMIIGNEPQLNRSWFGEMHFLAIYDSAFSSSDVLNNYTVGPVTQAPPSVDVGPDQTIPVGTVATIDATVVDDGLPDPPAMFTVQWSLVSGPGPVTFANPTSVDTTVSFSGIGTYVLRLTADDNALTSFKDLTVDVVDNQAPVVDAGPDMVAEAGGAAITLAGSVTDDPLPLGAPVTQIWSVVSGPGSVVFGSPTATTTTAAFTVPGTYLIRLTADDTDLTGVDSVSVTVASNGSPVVDAGADLTGEVGEPTPLSGTVSDDGLPTVPGFVTTTWTGSGPGTVTFSDPSSLTSTVTVDNAGTYTLTLLADDGGIVSSDTLTLTIATNIAPTVDAGPSSLVVPQGSALPLDGTVSDDGLPAIPGAVTATWSLVSGPGSATFADENDPDTTVQFGLEGSYVIRLTADDGALQSSDDITVAVTPPSRTTDGLVALYGFEEGSGTTIRDISGVGEPLDLEMVADSNISWIPGGVSFDAPSAIASPGPATKIIDAVRASNELTIEMWIKPDTTDPAQPGRVFTISDDASVRNISVGQGFWLNRPTNIWRVQSGYEPSGTPTGAVDSTDLIQLVFTRAADDPDGTGRLFVDGVRVGFVGRFVGLDQWNQSFPLTLGNEPQLNRSWFGEMHMVAVYDKGLSFEEIQENFGAGPGTQAPPTVDAGPDLSVDAGVPLVIDATVTDDGLPNPPAALTTTWSMVSGPGNVTFTDPGLIDTTATFDQAGIYVLELTADDGLASTADTITVTVTGNTAPTVDAGADITIEVSSPVALGGSASDDGLPAVPGTVTTTWSVVSGPGSVVFTDPSSPTTDATFGSLGSYLLRLTADDGQLTSSDEVTITVAQNVAPTVDAGADAVVAWGAAASLAGTVGDDGLPSFPGTVATTWSVLSGPGTVTFADPGALSTTATFAVDGVYVLQLSADDGSLVTTDTMTITAEPPTPRVTQGLQALYTFAEGSGSTVFDVSGVGTPLDLVIDNPGNVSRTSTSVTINASTFIASPGPATKLIGAAKATNEATIELWITPASGLPAEPGRLAGILNDTGGHNMVVSQGFFRTSPANSYDGRIWTTGNYNNSVRTPQGEVTTDLTHVVMVRESTGLTRMFVDGVERSQFFRTGDLSTWNDTFRLVLGSRLDAAFPWMGTYHLMAFYDRALTEADIAQNLNAGV